jgi:starch-binding outer membrane protein, SusD/RagB family
MKNIINYILFLLCLILFSAGCTRVLDKEPLDIISDAQVWDDPKLIEAYLTNLYSRTPMSGIFSFDDYGYWPATVISISDEGSLNYNWSYPKLSQGLLDGSSNEMGYWNYNLMRDINDFLIKITSGNVSDDIKQQYSAEARFLRAYVYFELVKRYGGVPIILIPQELDEGEALYVPRNTEKEVYDLIAGECDEISPILPPFYPEEDLGRVTRFAALALKSRAMLYAASIAKYGTVQLDGILGFPVSDADNYWQASLDASKAIMGEHQFSLYNSFSEDKAKNYQMIFLDKNNSEIILAKKFISVTYGHNVDDFYQPNFNYTYWGCMFSPSMEFIDSYEMKDGSSGIIDWANVTGDLNEIFRNKDPRFEASILYNGQQWSWDTVRIWRGIYTETGEFRNSETELYNGMDEIGRDQKTGQGPKTGFLMKKFLNPDIKFPRVGDSDQSWIVYRYAEVLLNYAEASFELGHSDDALNAVNELRIRAGITTLSSISLDIIRHERKIELAFETQRFWDLRRWRIAETELNGNIHGAFPFYHFATNRFEYEVVNAEPFIRIFKPAYYYLPITEDRINNDPNLVENPGYN